MDKLFIIRQPIANELALLNETLTESLHTNSPLMNEVIQVYLESKGKQIRPILVLLCAKLFGDVPRAAIDAAASLEMLHNASLIHDDVVDESQKRRGLPTINHLYDNRIAVLTGDYFVSCALACSIKTNKMPIVSCLGILGRDLARGEIDQLSNARNHLLDEAAYFEVIRRKTASLFYACMQVGALAANAPVPMVERLSLFGEKLGLCFQIKDDIFDYYEDKVIGKPTGNDLREGKVTLPLIYAITHGEGSENERMRTLLLNEESLSAEEVHTLIEYAKREGGIEYAYETMKRIRNEAVALLADFPPSDIVDALIAILDYTIDREK
ncbi:MAG TPA: polyprenyl synthetase family protein [Candidatus Barnesiella excrementigallinarum]|nr:polyprenyl synthetase family protein [Candidatus Barnesiella excrementigallinarum]